MDRVLRAEVLDTILRHFCVIEMVLNVKRWTLQNEHELLKPAR